MSVTLILGPMFSSKTLELISIYERYKYTKKKVLVIKHSIDNRYSNDSYLCTHNNIKIPALECTNLYDIETIDRINILDYDVILIDEIQFFKDNFEFCNNMANKGKIVYASGLSSNFKREMFKNMDMMISNADNIIFKQAVCQICYINNASFTIRLSNETREIIIGGDNIYKAVCRKCYTL